MMTSKYNKEMKGIFLVLVVLFCTQNVHWLSDLLSSVPSIYDHGALQYHQLLQICSKSDVPLQYEISNYIPKERNFTDSEKNEISNCTTRDIRRDYKTSRDAVFMNTTENIRWDIHDYLNSDSTVIQVGGKMGVHSDHLQTLYKPRKYIILEPKSQFYNILVDKYANMSNIVVLNFGLASEDRFDFVEKDNGSTMRFLPNNLTKNNSETLRQVNATTFFLSMAVGFFEVDLLTINCEGCEYEVLDALLDSNLINNFHHVQISFHHRIGHADTLERWCQYQQLFSRTHRVMYQYPLFWESWARKDLHI